MPARSCQEGLGEVQEMIDICDFAVGLSRQLYGLTIASERPGHGMRETWHPLGPVRRHHRLQLPGRGVGLERRARAGLRRSGDLEAVGEDAARARWPRRRSASGPLAAIRRTRRTAPGASRHRRTRGRARRWSSTRTSPSSRPPARPAWAGRCRQAVARRLRPLHPRTGRQQRHDRGAVGRPRPGPAGHRLLRRRHVPASAAPRCAG